MTRTESELRAAATAADQEHLFDFWSDLSEPQQASLLAQIDALDFDVVAQLRELQKSGGAVELEGELEPPETFPLKRNGATEERARRASQLGDVLLGAGRVGFVLVAGGQASRLGYNGPKGAFPVGPVSGRTLFETHGRRLRAASKRYDCPMPWYVMTSVQNDAATRTFMKEHHFFGLPEEDIFFFSQAMLPALDDDGHILMAKKHELFLAPNGHGGVLEALQTSGALRDMEQREIDLVSYFQVDNPLVRPADPMFFGLHRLADANMSSKVVEKTEPDEKVGVLGRIDGMMGIIEYSDLSDDLRKARDASGGLRFRAGNIAVHAIDRHFIDTLTKDGLKLPWHLARKKMKVCGPKGTQTESWGTKFETFVFDALSQASNSVTFEVSRALEFSPVKNAKGGDSPETARRDLCAMYADWVKAAGRELPPADADGIIPVEIDPMVAESREAFIKARSRPAITPKGHHYDG